MIATARSIFSERVGEIRSYLDFLAALEQQTIGGPPTIGNHVVTTDQQRMLYSSLYLQLYNLVETTVIACIESLATQIAENSKHLPSQLSDALRTEWVSQMARTHEDLNVEHRLKFALELCDFLVQQLPIGEISIGRGGGGNWDDEEITRLLKRLGFEPRVAPETVTEAKRHVKNELGALQLVRVLRNQLAHGSISFVQCGEGVVVSDLKDLNDRVVNYLGGVVDTFGEHISAQSYLSQAHRQPAVA